MIMTGSDTYFLEGSAHVSLKEATADSSRDKTEECDQKVWNVFDQFDINIPCSATYFLKVGARVSLKVASRVSLRGKKLWKFRFLDCFSKGKTEECDPNVWNIFNQFGITIPCSATYFLEVGARVSLKVATKGSLRGKKSAKKISFLGCFSKAKTEECDQNIWSLSDKFGNIMTGSDTYFMEVSAHVSLRVATDDFCRDKETMKN